MLPRRLQSLFVVFMVLAIPSVTPWGASVFAVPEATGAEIIGTATYRERIALSDDAEFEATLEDVTRADAPAEVIARVSIEDPGQVPIAFEISYDPRRISPRRRYGVRASIYEDGRLRLTNSQAYPVLTQGQGSRVTVLMRRVPGDDAGRERGRGRDRREGERRLGNLPATFTGLLPCADCVGIRYQINLLPAGAYMQRMTYLRVGRDESFYDLGAWSLSRDGRVLTLDGGRERTYWAVENARTLLKVDREGRPIDSRRPRELTRRPGVEPMEPRVQLTGMFRYMADAARFRDCRSGLQWPVEMIDDYRALERAYAGRRIAPGSELLVSLDARIEQMPKADGGGTEATLVVEKFLRAMPGQDCEGRAHPDGLGNTRWRPIRIGDRPVVVSDEEREPWIELEPRSSSVTGSGSCNRISGSYESRVGGALRFRGLITTKMFCPSMDLEYAFLRALNETRRYRVSGRILELADDRGRVLARLEERNLR